MNRTTNLLKEKFKQSPFLVDPSLVDDGVKYCNALLALEGADEYNKLMLHWLASVPKNLTDFSYEVVGLPNRL